RHGTDEALRRRRRKRRADLQQLRDERSGLVWDPVSHHDATPWFGDPDHLPGYVKGLGRKHGAEYGKRQIKRMVADSVQVARISFLKCKSSEACLCRSLVSGINEVFGNVDSNNVSPQTGERNRRGAISTAKVQHPQRRLYSER